MDWLRHTAAGVAIVVAYLALAALGAQFAVLDSLTVWYPPVGIAMAAAALHGWRPLPALAVAEILVGLLLFGVGDDLGWLVVPNGIAYAFVYTVAGRALGGLGGTDPTVSWRRPAAIVSLGVLLAPVAGALVGVGFQWLAGVVTTDEVARALLVWALGDAVGAASVGVTIVTVAVRARRGGRWWALPDQSIPTSLVSALLPSAVLAALAVVFDGVVPFAAAALAPFLVVCVVGGVPAAGLAALPTTLTMTVVASSSFADDLIGRTDLQLLQLVIVATGVFVAMVVEERRELRLQLSISEQHLELAQLQSRAGSFRWDVHNGEIEWSTGLIELLGLSEHPSDVAAYVERIHPDDREASRRRIAEAISTGVGYAAIHRLRPHGGGELTMRVEMRPRMFDGRVTEIVGTVTDVTVEERSRQRLAEALERERNAADHQRRAFEIERAAAAESREAQEIKEALLVAVSHEIRTPLTVVKGVAETLTRPEILRQLGPHAHIAERLERQTRRLQRVLVDLLDVDRIARGVVEPRRRDVDVARLIDDVVDRLRIEDSRLTVSVADDARQFSLDAALTARIVEHLLLNAQRHAPSSPIEVSATQTEEQLRLQVADRGPGIDPTTKDTLLAPFATGPGDDAKPSTGLGLYLVDRFTALHHGTLLIEDRDGGGTAVTVVLPNGTSMATAG